MKEMCWARQHTPASWHQVTDKNRVVIMNLMLWIYSEVKEAGPIGGALPYLAQMVAVPCRVHPISPPVVKAFFLKTA
jgi:hypothetical protein